MKILTVIGARPQIIKASALSRAIRNEFNDKIEEILLHTGQHYDANMSDVFFREMNIPMPKYNLNVGSASHGVMTAKIIIGLEEILFKEKPDYIVLYGDTNSTLAGSIAASKLHIPIAHIEAGLRSFDKNMPEEINRILCDHTSTLLFCPTRTGYNNLVKEGFSKKISAKPSFNHPNLYLCGDIMYDNTLYFSKICKNNPPIKKFCDEPYILCTIHRPQNTDNRENLNNIFCALIYLAKNHRIILPLHPRTRKMMPIMLKRSLMKEIEQCKNIEIIAPQGYLEMTYLEMNTSLVITDSGGVQKEAYFHKKPSVIIRPETEWVEIVENECATIANTDTDAIIRSSLSYLSNQPNNYPDIFGDGKTAEFICKKMLD